jgi:hypothetical protein
LRRQPCIIGTLRQTLTDERSSSTKPWPLRHSWLQPHVVDNPMSSLLREIRDTPLLWMLALVPVVLVAVRIVPAAHTLLFVLAVLAIVPLAALLSHATEAVAEKTGDTIGGLPGAHGSV